MSLFSPSDIKNFSVPMTESPSALTLGIENIETKIGKSKQWVNELFPSIEDNTITTFSSAGIWSMHDLAFHVLDLIGPAKITFATWSMTQEPCQQLIDRLNNGQVTELWGLFDVRVKIRNPKVYAFAKFNITKVRESICHAKVTVIENDKYAVTIIGSANWTNNPRIEAGDIIVNKKVAAFHKSWIIEEINKANPFDD